MYRLKPGWGVARESSGTLLFGGEDRSFAVHARRELLDELLAAVSGTGAVGPPPVVDFLEQLRSRGILTEWNQESEGSGRFDRQRDYFSAFCEQPAEAHERVEGSSLLLLGLGGTGSEFLRLMVAAGVRRYALVDKDLVELSNLNRQTVYALDDVGKAKVDVCRSYIEARLPEAECRTDRTTVKSEGDVAALVEAVAPDLTLIAIDEPLHLAQRVAASLASSGHAFIVAGVGVRHGRSFPVSTQFGSETVMNGTTASIGTTNTISAAYAAHTALEHLSGVPMPFRMHHAP